MHEFFIAETHESIGLAWVKGNCNLVRMGHKHGPHIDGTRACPGYLPVALFSFDRSSPTVEPIYNREKVRIDIPEPSPDPDDLIRSCFT